MLKLKSILHEVIQEAPTTTGVDPVFGEVPFAAQYKRQISVPAKYSEFFDKLFKLKQVVNFPGESENASKLLSFTKKFYDPRYVNALYPHLKKEIDATRAIIVNGSLTAREKAINKIEKLFVDTNKKITLKQLLDFAYKLYDNETDDYDYDFDFNKYRKTFNLPAEPNTKSEEDLLNALLNWFDEPDAEFANKFNKYYPSIKKMRVKYPEIFKPNRPDKSPVFRGTSISTNTRQKLKKQKL